MNEQEIYPSMEGCNDRLQVQDDDPGLLQENLGVRDREQLSKRLKRTEDKASSLDKPNEKQAVGNKLFEGSDNVMETKSESPLKPESSRSARQIHSEESKWDYSKTDADFTVGNNGRPLNETSKKRKRIVTPPPATLPQEAQDIFGVDFDYSELEEYEYEFTQVDQGDKYKDEDQRDRSRAKEQPLKKWTEKSVNELYELPELDRATLTEEDDNRIINQDIPERMQLRTVPVTDADEQEIEEEAKWIYDLIFSQHKLNRLKSQDQVWWPSHPTTPAAATISSLAEEEHKGKFLPKIKKALEYIRKENFEVPFIAFYRKEYVGPELGINELWEIYRADAHYCQLQTRKSHLLHLFENIHAYQTQVTCQRLDDQLKIPAMSRPVTTNDYDRIKAIITPEEIKDFYLLFTLHYAHDITLMKTLRVNSKRSISLAPFRKMIFLQPLTKLFGLTPEKFAENVRHGETRHEIVQHSVAPLEAAKDFKCPQLPTSEAVLKAAKFIVAIQISREPALRHSVRQVLFENAKLSVHPTEVGVKKIDENHPAYPIKYLKDKPVWDLKRDEFLRLTIAEQEKLLIISIGKKLRSSDNSDYVDHVKKFYMLEKFSPHVQMWNDLRSECVEFAVEKLLLPILKQELRAKLLKESKEWILKACSNKLYEHLATAPYKPSFYQDEDEDFEVSKGLRVLSLAYAPPHGSIQESFACFLSPDGEPLDHLRLKNLIKIGFQKPDRVEKETADLLALKAFIWKNRPHVIVIGAESREALAFQKILCQLIFELKNKGEFSPVDVHILDNQVAKVYAISGRARTDFPAFPRTLREAVSLGRLIQNPMMEYSQLCGPGDQILRLHYHKLQHYVPKAERLERLHSELINRVNEVGVDVNRAISNPHTSHLVQFVCGLGVRKAAALLRTLKMQGNEPRLENRVDLISKCHLGPGIFINCAGFIKITGNPLVDNTGSFMEILDGSRIHPETYEWARKMVMNAMEYYDDDYYDENALMLGAFKEILKVPEILMDLDLDNFAHQLERQGFGKKRNTLYDIRTELSGMYRDWRVPFSPPVPEDIFNILTKETAEPLYKGKLIKCSAVGFSHKEPDKEQLDNNNPIWNAETHKWECPFCTDKYFPDLSKVRNHLGRGKCPGRAGVRVRLENGISGFIPLRKLSDEEVTNPGKWAKPDQRLYCRLIKIDLENFEVECSARKSDLVDEGGKFRPKKDNFYDHEAARCESGRNKLI